MGRYSIDANSRPGVLILGLEGTLADAEMRDFVAAHNRAVDAFGGATYRVFVDLRAMLPLSPEGAAAFQRAKAYSAAQPNFRGSAVCVASSIVSIQHRRTSVEGGVFGSELISEDEAACWEHLRSVKRKR